MLPLRSHLSIATAALVLVVPVVAGVIVGGFARRRRQRGRRLPRLRLRFIPPYYTPDVGAAQNWVALGVYVVVMLLWPRSSPTWSPPAPKPSSGRPRSPAALRAVRAAGRGPSVEELLETIVARGPDRLRRRGVALLLPDDGRLAIAASAGETLSRGASCSQLDPQSGCRSAWAPARSRRRTADRGPDRASGRPVGHPGPAGAAGVEPRTGPCCAPSPTTPPWPWSGPSCASRPCARSCSRRSTACASALLGRGLPRPAHPARHHEGGLLDPPRPHHARSPRPTPTSCTA